MCGERAACITACPCAEAARPVLTSAGAHQVHDRMRGCFWKVPRRKAGDFSHLGGHMPDARQPGAQVPLPPAGLTRGGAWTRWRWTNPHVRSGLIQIVLAALLLWFLWSFYANAQANLDRIGVNSGFGFLDQRAGFSISQTLIAYDENMSYGRVFLVGLLNTLLVAACGIVLATVFGFLMGIARLSSNAVIRFLSAAYVEVTRNLPPLFQIMFWYLLALAVLPGPRASWGLGLQPVFSGFAGALNALGLTAFASWMVSAAQMVGPPQIFLSNRGLAMPRLLFEDGAGYVLGALAVALLLSAGLAYWARQRRERTGRAFPAMRCAMGLVVLLPLLAALATHMPFHVERPELRGFNFSGGLNIIPEFVALLLALSIYTAGYIAEIVRAGILSVQRGQMEAARALGLNRAQMLRLVILPQAMRVIVPPLTSQYVNITKNSTLGVAIGYPDLVSLFAGTVLERTGLAIEIIAMIMAVYLTISLLTSGIMTLYGRHIALVER